MSYGAANRMEMTRRFVALLRILPRYRYMPRWSVLAAELRLSERTVRRYVQALDDAGWPLPEKREAA